MSYLGIPPFGRTARTVTEVIATSGQTTFYPSGGGGGASTSRGIGGASVGVSTGTSGAGGSGVVIVRYLTPT